MPNILLNSISILSFALQISDNIVSHLYILRSILIARTANTGVLFGAKNKKSQNGFILPER